MARRTPSSRLTAGVWIVFMTAGDPTRYPTPDVALAVKAFLQAAIGPGQADLNKIGYIPLSPQFQQRRRLLEEVLTAHASGQYCLTIATLLPQLEGIVTEMFTARTSERQGRLIDSDEKASMEKKKKEGYF